MLMIDIAGTALSAEDRELLQHPKVSGVILFSRNYVSLKQLSALTHEIHNLRSPPLIIAVDHEGGRVQRFRKDFTVLPLMRTLGDLYDKNPTEAIAQAKKLGKIMGAELKSAGIDYTFAPVLDRDTGRSEVIGDRSFHTQADIIALLASALLRGMHSTGLKGVGKHFPGHGYVKADSHVDIPIDNRSFEDIATADLLPFQRLIETGIDGIMPAHVIYEKCDAVPAGFSFFWLKTILRQQLHFEGLIFSDDLMMAGATSMGDIKTRVEKATSAGCDILLICNDREAVFKAIL